ncbi:MAG: GNAT family N-acetyltransferase, partial [Planktomarina sp.]
LLMTCLDFAKAAGYRGLFRWTHESHTAACALYVTSGFILITSRPVNSFGKDLTEQRFQITF